MGLFRRKEKKEKLEKEKKGNQKNIQPPKKVGLCLGGGGLRGFGHIGALKALEEAGLSFDLVVGTSIGSFIAAMYAYGMHPDEMMIYSETVELKSVKKGFMLSPSDPIKIGQVVTNFTGKINIEDLKKKFACVAVDLITARQIIFDKGPLEEAISASCCVPLIFRPLVANGMHLVDGGVLNNIPADVTRMLGADHVVTIDINPTRGGGTKELGLIDVLKATFSIMSSVSSYEGLRQSDILIAPNMSKFKSTSKDGYKEMIEIGYHEAKKMVPEIKKLFES